MGGISLLFLFVALIGILRRANNNFHHSGGYDNLFIGAVIISTLAYGMAYSFYWFIMVFIGMGLSMLDKKTEM
jgi:hypothetical protein